MTKLIISLILTGTTLTASYAGTIQFQSGEKQIPLLELYTSEGCSSCPPAEAWLAPLKDSPDLWTNIVPVAFHVDYWNSLGWKDRWSSSEFADRQRAYAAAWKGDSIYTPCFVLNGKEWHDWFGIRSFPSTLGPTAGVLTVNSGDTNHWIANFAPAQSEAAHFEIYAALLAGGLNSDVKAGENRGRRLHHEFALLNLTQAAMTTKDGVATARFITDTARYHAENELALAVWVSREDHLEPLQATGAWLIPPSNTNR